MTPGRELSEGRYQALVEAVPQLSWTTDAQGTCDYLSPQWTTYTGVPTEDLLGLAWLAYLHPEDRERTEHLWRAATAGEGDYDLDYRIRRADGEYRWFRTRGRRIEDGTWVGTCTDIQEARELERTLRVLTQIERRAREESDPARIMHHVSESLRAQFGASRCAYAHVWDGNRFTIEDEATTEPTSLVGDYTLEAFGASAAERLRRGEPLVIRDVRREVSPEQGGEAFLALNVEASLCWPLVKEGKLTAMLAVHQDRPRDWTLEEVSLLRLVAERSWSAIERARSERELLALNAELETRVAERTKGLEAAVRELEGFTYSVAHDLRAPVRAMIGYARLIDEDFGEELSADARRALGRIDANAKKLAALVDGLLAYARLGRRDVTRERFDISAMVAETVAEIAIADPRPMELLHEEGLVVEADREQVRLLVRNLVENAAKYRSGPLKLRFGQKDGAFFLKDNGIGLEMQYADKIFMPFERLHRDNEYPGTGIGLANVARIAERHGGRVWVESDGPGTGATFWFTLG